MKRETIGTVRCFSPICTHEKPAEVRKNNKGKYYYWCPNVINGKNCGLWQSTGEGFSAAVESQARLFSDNPKPEHETIPEPEPKQKPVEEKASDGLDDFYG
ncbi:MAG: hypothetical protein KZQ94_20950 [Candidatus Thiodiazotropha sp. (ex Troendleina suluensis)]|nr:hypothetical protein [Candidatus Thiodiazotropha sp. (ex Troendleina suluensis)]